MPAAFMAAIASVLARSRMGEQHLAADRRARYSTAASTCIPVSAVGGVEHRIRSSRNGASGWLSAKSRCNERSTRHPPTVGEWDVQLPSTTPLASKER